MTHLIGRTFSAVRFLAKQLPSKTRRIKHRNILKATLRIIRFEIIVNRIKIIFETYTIHNRNGNTQHTNNTPPYITI